MPEDSQDKQSVIKYFGKKGVEARLFPKTSAMPNPDLKLYIDGNLFAYCELKSIMPYELDLPTNFPSSQVYQNLHNDPAFNNIQNKIHEASKQLRSVNLDHDLPNIIFFINHHKYRGIQDLRWVIKGQPSEKAPDVFDMTYLKRLLEKDDLSVVDYIICSDSFSDKAFYYVRSESPFRDILKQRISSKAWENLI